MKLADFLGRAPIAIQCHNIPDADALASGFALYRYFEASGATPRFFYGGPPVGKPNLTGMIEALGIPVEHQPQLKEWDGLLITVDCQYGAGNVMRVEASEIAVIDHHIQERELPALCDLRPWLGSCSTLVWDLLRQEAFPLDIPLATALYYGLYMDTNGFSEMRHPLDRDMWDSLSIDAGVVKRLRLSNLSLADLSNLSTALNAIVVDEDLRCARIPAPPCDPNILGVISDLAMEVDMVDLATAYCILPNGDVKYSVRTSVREVKASELAAWIAKGVGSGGGHREKAGGYIAGGRYAERFGGKPLDAYMEECIRTYCRAFKILDCADPVGMGEWLASQAMASYRKLPVRQGFVRCADLFQGGCELQLRMLEGDMDVAVDADTVLMIGVMGEVYPTSCVKFARDYRILDGPYVPEGVLQYEPVALNRDTGMRVRLLDHARACESLGGVTIKALSLDERVKVFTRWDPDEYFTGNPGDWLVAAAKDDAYIVTREVFARTYGRDMTGEDFSLLKGACRVVKRGDPLRVVFAEAAGSLETLEGVVSYAKGDAILEGPAGDRWPVSRDVFNRRYRPCEETIAGREGLYRPEQEPSWAVQMQEAFAVGLPNDKGTLRGRTGDWLVQYAPGEYGIVDGKIFLKTYDIL